MIRFVALATFLSVSFICEAQLPEKWSAGFVIRLSHTGSMRGGETHIKFTYDSCIYVHNSDQGPTTKHSFTMTEEMRHAILTKMHALKADKIKSDAVAHVVNDGWSRLMCLGTTCVEGGPSAKMSDKDKAAFANAYAYLEEFALTKK